MIHIHQYMKRYLQDVNNYIDVGITYDHYLLVSTSKIILIEINKRVPLIYKSSVQQNLIL